MLNVTEIYTSLTDTSKKRAPGQFLKLKNIKEVIEEDDYIKDDTTYHFSDKLSKLYLDHLEIKKEEEYQYSHQEHVYSEFIQRVYGFAFSKIRSATGLSRSELIKQSSDEVQRAFQIVDNFVYLTSKLHKVVNKRWVTEETINVLQFLERNSLRPALNSLGHLFENDSYVIRYNKIMEKK
jgi:hypothetical protein